MCGRIDLVVGEGFSLTGTWVCVRGAYDFISEARDSYWVHLDEYKIDLKVGKKTELGGEITQLLSIKADRFEQDNALKRAVLKHVIPILSPEQFVSILQHEREDGFKQGQENIREGLKTLLQIA